MEVRRSTLILLVLLAVAAGLAWYLRQPDNAIQAALAGTLTPTLEAPGYIYGDEKLGVSELIIENAEGQSVKLSNVNQVWKVTAGYEDLANQDVAQQEAYGILALRIIGEVDNPGSLADFGLENPAYTVSVSFLDGTSGIIKVGKATVTERGYYVLTENGRVVILNKYAVEDLVGIVASPPFMFTATPSATPAPPSATPEFSVTPEASATPEATPTATP
jgi:hypothetical protein